MKKYIYLLLSLIVWLTPTLIISCAPQSGQRVWNIATKNIFITQTIESILDGISGFDVVAVFSDLDQLFNKAATIESKASLLLQDIGILQQDLVQDLSKTNQIVSNIGLLESSFALLDTSAVFTALDALQTTIVSAMDLLNNDLESIVTQIDNITLSEIDYAHTIASQLDQLDTDVNIVNSLLDAVAKQFSLSTFFSLTDILQQGFVAIESNVQIVDNEIATGFAGTFSVLEQNLLLAQTIESLADELVVMQGSDLTGTYSLLDQLDISVQTMDSLADVLVNTYATIISSIDILGSALDESVSKYLFVESRTALLTQKIETLILKPAFSVIDHATSLLDRDILLLSQMYAADLPALTSSIESELENIITEQDVQISDLDSIATEFSLLPILPSETTTISKLDKANSMLDDVIDDAFATENYINAATHIEYINDTESLLNQINYTASLVPIISSNMALVDNALATTNNTLDTIDALAQSNLDDVITIESMLDTLSFIPQPSTSISSSLSVINSQEDVVISKLAVASSLISTENNEEQGLIGDFQATWTISQSIDTKLAQAYNSLSLTDRAIQSKFVSYSSVFTALDGIIANEATINSQVDVYNSMVDALTNKINTDLNGVFTALTAVNASEISSASQLSTINSKLAVVQTELGFPIYQANIPLTITTPGRYYLAQNISYSGASNAITINTNNVSIDLNEKTLQYTGASSVNGILINNVDNTKIINGSIAGFNASIQTGTGTNTNSIIRDVKLISGGMVFNSSSSGRNHKFYNNFLWSNLNQAPVTVQGAYTNFVIDNCIVKGSPSGFALMEIDGGPTRTNVQVSNCYLKYNNTAVSTDGIAAFNGLNASFLIQNNIVQVNNRGYNLSGTTTDLTLIGNVFMGNAGAAFNFNNPVTRCIIHKNDIIRCSSGASTTTNFSVTGLLFSFNNFIQNTGGNVSLNNGGGVTLLGNFAFNTNATGTPNNTNYNFSGNGTVFTGKYVTISQKTGVSGTTTPTYWHNINMLP